MPEDNKNEQQIEIELNEETAEGVYCNFAIIQHSNSEFVLDFIRMLPGIPKARVKSRVVLTPEHAKRLLGALSDNVMKFEDQFGEIQITDDMNNPSGFPINFNGQTGMA